MPTHNVEDEEVSEVEPKKPKGILKKRVRSGRNGSDPNQKGKVRKTTKANSHSSPGRSHSSPLPKDFVVGDSRARIVGFINKMGMGLELDGFKENVRRVVGDMGRASLNSYWTRFTCGLRWRTGRTTRDIAHFSFNRGNPGEPDMKRVVAIGCAVELVTCLIYIFFCTLIEL